MTKSLLVIAFCSFYSISSIIAANIDTTVVRDLTHDWYFYNSRTDSYLPLVSKDDFKANTIYFDVNVSNYANNLLRIESSQTVSVFLDNQLIEVMHGSKDFRLDSLSDVFSKELLHFTIYRKGLNPFEISAAIIGTRAAEQHLLSEETIIIREREFSSFEDFVIVAVVLLFGFLAALYNYFPKALSDFFKLTRTFSLRESDETLFKTRPLSRVNLLFYSYLCFLIAFVLIFLANRLEVHYQADVLHPDSFWDGMFNWLQLSGIIFCWFFAKYLLISNISALFYLRGFAVSHFFNYVRMTLFIFTAALVLILCSYYGFEITEADYYKSLFTIIFAFLGIRVLILFFKLLNAGPYQTLHLFSYLCGTEVIPFVILLYLGINQPF